MYFCWLNSHFHWCLASGSLFQISFYSQPYQSPNIICFTVLWQYAGTFTTVYFNIATLEPDWPTQLSSIQLQLVSLGPYPIWQFAIFSIQFIVKLQNFKMVKSAYSFLSFFDDLTKRSSSSNSLWWNKLITSLQSN